MTRVRERCEANGNAMQDANGQPHQIVCDDLLICTIAS
jgi:hypothetical protein